MIQKAFRILASATLAICLSLTGLPGMGLADAHAYQKRTVASYVASKSLKSNSPVIQRKMMEMSATKKGRSDLVHQFRRIVRSDASQRPFVARKFAEIKKHFGIGDSFSKRPYSSRAIEKRLFTQYGQTAVKSSTLPPAHFPNVRHAGRSVMAAGHSVPFDHKGMPNFDKHLKYDTRLAGYNAKADSQTHFRSATRDLRDAMKRGEVPKGTFDARQTKAIEDGAPKIPGYTWHHHQDKGRMQLVPDAIHAGARHAGGRALEK